MRTESTITNILANGACTINSLQETKISMIPRTRTSPITTTAVTEKIPETYPPPSSEEITDTRVVILWNLKQKKIKWKILFTSLTHK